MSALPDVGFFALYRFRHFNSLAVVSSRGCLPKVLYFLLAIVGFSVAPFDAVGGFLTARSYSAGKYPWALAVGDFNGDGAQDLAVLDFSAVAGHSCSVTILLG
jgi:hypothetical protein